MITFHGVPLEYDAATPFRDVADDLAFRADQHRCDQPSDQARRFTLNAVSLLHMADINRRLGNAA